MYSMVPHAPLVHTFAHLFAHTFTSILLPFSVAAPFSPLVPPFSSSPPPPRSLATHKNEAVKIQENNRDMMRIQNAFIDDTVIMEPSRHFIKEGDASQGGIPTSFFLFSDAFFIGTRDVANGGKGSRKKSTESGLGSVRTHRLLAKAALGTIQQCECSGAAVTIDGAQVRG